MKEKWYDKYLLFAVFIIVLFVILFTVYNVYSTNINTCIMTESQELYAKFNIEYCPVDDDCIIDKAMGFKGKERISGGECVVWEQITEEEK